MKNSLCNFALQSIVLLMAIVVSPVVHAEPISPALDPEKVIGLEAIVATGYDDGPFYAKFGHALLRFVKADGNFATDMVLSLQADVPANKVDALKGLDGGYRMIPTFDTFGDYWNTYVATEERPLLRYVISSTPEMRARLLETLQNWIKNPEMAGNYTFLNNNCVGGLATLLEQSGFPSTIGLNPIIPTGFGHWLTHSLLSFYPELQIESPKKLFDKAALLLAIPVDDFLHGRNWPKEAAENLHANLSDLEVKRLLLYLPAMPFAVRSALVLNHRFDNGAATLEQAMSFQSVPNSLYQVCADAACMETILSSANKIWPAKKMKRAIEEDRFVYSLVTKERNASNYDFADREARTGSFSDQVSRFPRNLQAIPALIFHDQLFLRAVAPKED